MLRELLAQTIYGKAGEPKRGGKSKKGKLSVPGPSHKISVTSTGSSGSKKGRKRAGSAASSVGELSSWLRLLALISDKDNDALNGAKEGEQEAFVPAEGEIEDDRQLSREKLLEKIREKKAVIEKLRCQPWPMRRKRRTLKLAQKYLQRHESKVSKTHLLKEELTKKWKKFKRWLINVSIYLIPWEAKIKAIESHFGSVVSSYFTFLRWIFWVNVIMMLLMVSFVVIPECLADTFPDEERRGHNDTIKRKRIDPQEQASADYLQTIWDYKGYLGVSPLFYGYYSNKPYILTKIRYQLPLAYFLVNLFTLAYSFFAILRRMAANTRLSKLTSGKTEQYVFAWKMFAGWDYTIGNAETAANTVMANANKFRESIMEFKIKQKEAFAWVLFLLRIIANIIILGMIATSTYVVNYVVEVSHKKENPTAFEQNQVAIVISFITLVFPNFFELISRGLERFHPRTGLRVHLGRILALYLLNFYTLIFALFTNITRITQKVDDNETTTSPRPRSAALVMERNPVLEAFNSSTQLRFSRSPMELEALNVSEIVEPILNLSTFLLANVTTASPFMGIFPSIVQSGTAVLTAAAVTVTASTPIPPLIHFLKLISQGHAKETDDDFMNFTLADFQTATRTVRQTVPRRDSYYRYATVRGRRTTTTVATTSVTGPLLWTTVHPEAGTVGVSEANAFLKENISEWMRNNTNDLETFPPLGGRTMLPNGTVDPKSPSGRPLRPGSRNSTQSPQKEQSQTPGAGAPERQVDPGGGVSSGTEVTSAKTTTAVTAISDNIGNKSRTLEPRDESLGRARAERMSLRERRLLCWETWVGQEIAKLITMDLVMTIAAILIIDFFRGLWVRYCNRWWCWNLETVFPEYGEFKVAENVLHIINNQGMIWLGLFFAPMLPVMNIFKLIIIMYIRGWAVVTCNVPATQVFRASRSNNFYLLLLLLMLFLCTLPVGYVIAKLRPSDTCGPFSYNLHFYSVITNRLEDGVPKYIYERMSHLASPGIVIPVLVLLALIIYFLVSLIRGLREANQDLQKQLVHERTEEKRKIYQLAGGGKHPKGPTGHSSSGLPETKKVDLNYLPEKEKVRREVWRSKAPLSDDEESPVQASDNDFSTQSPSSFDVASPATPRDYPEFPPAMNTSASNHFLPSLKSLPEEAAAAASSEVEDGDDDDRQKLLTRPTEGPSRNGNGNRLKGQNHWSHLPLGLLQRQSPQQPTVTTPLLAPTIQTPSHSPSASSSRSHSPAPPRVKQQAIPRFPTDANLHVPTTPATESWPTSSYDNNYPTPATPSAQSLSGQSPLSDLTSKQIADMLSPTKFSPTTFQEFMTTPTKSRPIKALKVTADTPLPSTEIRPRLQPKDILIHTSDVLIHMSDNDEKYPSDSGRATMTERSTTGSGDTPVPRPRHLAVLGPETDTGTESEMEKFAKSRLRGSIDGDSADWEPTEHDSLLATTEPPRKYGRALLGQRPKERRHFARPMTSDFVPWPSPDPIKPKSILKHIGPPGRGVGDTLSPPLSPTETTPEHSVSPRRRFTVSVSPGPSGLGDSISSAMTTDSEGDFGGKKRYIIRQTPSPSPKLRRAHVDTPNAPTKLSVVSEVTIIPRLASKPPLSQSAFDTMPKAIDQRSQQSDDEDERRLWASNMENNNVPFAQERPSRAQYPSRARLVESHSANTPLSNIQSGPAKLTRHGSGSSAKNQSTATKSKKHPSKETMI